MANTTLIRTRCWSRRCVASACARRRSMPPTAGAAHGRSGRRQRSSSRFVPLGVGKAVVIDLPRDTKDVLVADPDDRQCGRALGAPRLHDRRQGRPDQHLFLRCRRPPDRRLRYRGEARPERHPRCDPAGRAESRYPRRGRRTDGVILTGNGASPADAQQAVRSSPHRLVGAGDKVVNAHHRPRPRPDQSAGHRRGSSARRDQAARRRSERHRRRRFGSAQVQQPKSVPGLRPARWLRKTPSPAHVRQWPVNAMLRAMERAGVVRTLAEPNLTAISGESANFLAGGEFPILAGYSCDHVTGATAAASHQIQFKKFGISLGFTPVVLSEGRVSLRSRPRCRSCRPKRALAVRSLRRERITIPSLKVRRAETTVEIPSGGALALAGMIQEQTKQQISGLPGLMQLPILGALFKSRDYVNRQTELMILVTPYIVRAGRAEGSVAAGRRLRGHLRPVGRIFSAVSTGFTASPARSIRTACIAANTASFWIERRTRRRSMTANFTIAPRARRRRWRCASLAVAGWRSLAGCYSTTRSTRPRRAIPNDYRKRHPIAIREGDRDGRGVHRHSRGGLTPTQRAEVRPSRKVWRGEATGGIMIDVPARHAERARRRRRAARNPFDLRGRPALPMQRRRGRAPISPRIRPSSRRCG